MKKEKIHFVHEYLLNPVHPISVAVIGCGGTGSNVLVNLVAMHLSLKALGHAGLYVYAFDDDTVTEANAARQLFYPSDIGINKAEVLISRINRSYGLDWLAIPNKFDDSIHRNLNNITISCVDSMKSRKAIGKTINQAMKKKERREREDSTPYYWIDTGNGKDYGQIILGTIEEYKYKSKEYHNISKLPDVTEVLKGAKDARGYDEPSCSLMEALGKQDLYINKNIAMYATDMLWKMFRQGRINFRGLYVNLGNLQINPIQL